MKNLKYIALLLMGVTLISATSLNDKFFEIVKNLEIFTNVYKEINKNYVDEVDPSQLMKTGIDAMLESLDPYTNYYSESQIESYRIAKDGKYNGIGAKSVLMDDWVTITALTEGGAAHQAGLKPGDQLRSINGASTAGKTNDDVVKIMRGFPGTEVNVEIKRPGVQQLIPFTMTRGNVELANVPYSGMVSDEIGYISLTTFTANAGKNVARALKTLKRDNDNLQGVILDLRFNGGGLLREAISVSNIFIDKNQEIVTTKSKIIEQDKSYKTREEPIDKELALVVLINKNSASASEIVSGVIQDLDRGVIMGQRSFGKGLVQNTAKVGYNTQLKLTISKYYIPSGRCIQSVAYENGEPKNIPDEERAKFSTKNGRTVLDGGGIQPDVNLDLEENPTVLNELLKNHHIFKYVNKYVANLDSLPAVENYSFNDYQDFVNYVSNQKFTFELESNDALEELNKIAKKEELDKVLSVELDNIKKELANQKQDDLQQYQEIIQHKIENEIVSRFYFENGSKEQSLRRDEEIDAAINLLTNKSAYEKILKG